MPKMKRRKNKLFSVCYKVIKSKFIYINSPTVQPAWGIFFEQALRIFLSSRDSRRVDKSTGHRDNQRANISQRIYLDPIVISSGDFQKTFLQMLRIWK